MKLGCPKEIKPQEFRVGMTPNAAAEAVCAVIALSSKKAQALALALPTAITKQLALPCWTQQQRFLPPPT